MFSSFGVFFFHFTFCILANPDGTLIVFKQRKRKDYVKFYNLSDIFFLLGVNVFPESAYLVLVWETLAMSLGQNYKTLPVIFNDLKFYGEAVIQDNTLMELQININKIGRKFEVGTRFSC